jgi:hypothetical protein
MLPRTSSPASPFSTPPPCPWTAPRGVLVETVTGRPIKVEGNPHHPASLGATDIHAQAAVLDLWDPDRSQTILHERQPAAWTDLLAVLAERGTRARTDGGRGLAVLTGTCASPTLAGQLDSLLERLPEARWYRDAPVGEAESLTATRAAFGEALVPRLDLRQAAVILALDADPLGPGPDQVRNARAFAGARGPDGSDTYPRLYVAETSPTLTGAAADHRLAHPAGRIEALVARRCRADYDAVEAYSPFPIEGLPEALRLGKDRVSPWSLGGALFGLLSGFLIQTYSAVPDYPINVGGRPPFSWPAFLPASVILTLFWGAFGTLLAFFLLSRLPRLYHPVFNVPDFGAASGDGCFLLIRAHDPDFDPERARAWLREAGAERVEAVQR